MGVVFLRPMGNPDPRDPLTKFARYVLWVLLVEILLALVSLPFVIIYILVCT